MQAKKITCIEPCNGAEFTVGYDKLAVATGSQVCCQAVCNQLFYSRDSKILHEPALRVHLV